MWKLLGTQAVVTLLALWAFPAQAVLMDSDGREVFVVAVKATFSWQRDGESLMRRRKAAFFAEPALPRVTPLLDRARF